MLSVFAIWRHTNTSRIYHITAFPLQVIGKHNVNTVLISPRLLGHCTPLTVSYLLLSVTCSCQESTLDTHIFETTTEPKPVFSQLEASGSNRRSFRIIQRLCHLTETLRNSWKVLSPAHAARIRLDFSTAATVNETFTHFVLFCFHDHFRLSTCQIPFVIVE